MEQEVLQDQHIFQKILSLIIYQIFVIFLYFPFNQ